MATMNRWRSDILPTVQTINKYRTVAKRDAALSRFSTCLCYQWSDLTLTLLSFKVLARLIQYLHIVWHRVTHLLLTLFILQFKFTCLHVNVAMTKWHKVRWALTNIRCLNNDRHASRHAWVPPGIFESGSKTVCARNEQYIFWGVSIKILGYFTYKRHMTS